MFRLVLVVAALVSACGGSTPEAEGPDDTTSGLFGAGDRCPMLVGCHANADDSCPDPFLEFRADSDELVPRTVSLLETLAAEIQSTPQLRSLRIQGHASQGEDDEIAGQRAHRVRDWLIEAGVSDRLLDVSSEQTGRDDSTYATLEVVDCAGAGAGSRSKAGPVSIILF